MGGGIVAGLIIGFFLLICVMGIYSDIKEVRRGRQADNIKGRILLLSDDPKEIEKFAIDKQNVIDPNIVDQLINRLAEIKADRSIEENWKTRLQTETVKEELEVIVPQYRRSSTKWKKI